VTFVIIELSEKWEGRKKGTNKDRNDQRKKRKQKKVKRK
jgi:hypothetical protein